MIAQWMLYCVLCSTGLALAAALAEQALLAGRRQVRHAWIVAVVLSLGVPAIAFRFAALPVPATSAIATTPDVSVDLGIAPSTAEPRPVVITPAPPLVQRRSWNAALSRADEPLTIAWLTLSLVLGLYLVSGIALLTWLRRRWEKRVVLGVPVLVSERTGPALVGVVSPSIVVPAWSLDMDPAQLALMLRHEEEHRRAGDGQVLTAAQLALIIMPWNVALWWQLARLRVAVELDCDARVLRNVNARSYGDLLLEVARPRRGWRVVGMTAFAERATQLERRIRVMARHRDRALRGARAGAIAIGLATVSIAWAMPHPAVPCRNCRIDRKDIAPAAKVEEQVPRAMEHAPALPVKEDKALAAAVPRIAERVIAAPEQQRDTTAAVSPEAAHRAEAAFQRLFDGITLTATQEANARAMLVSLSVAQIAQDQAMIAATLEMLPRRAVIVAERDSALAALLQNDADRAILASRLGGNAGGGRAGGRVGGRSAGPDSLAGGRGGRVGGPRSGGAGQPASQSTVDGVFRRLFENIVLTTEQEMLARETIMRSQQSLVRTIQPPQPVRLAVNGGGGFVLMQAESESALAALLESDVDREVLQSRIAPLTTVIKIRQP
ncbi:MAG: peptidase BlaR1 [Gemmatimonadetes bacterium]|nr:peptidase BlaR1 [Gemmatimonadota bacterium]